MYICTYKHTHQIPGNCRQCCSQKHRHCFGLFGPSSVQCTQRNTHIHTHVRTHIHARTHTRTLRQEFHLHNLIGYGHTRTHTHTKEQYNKRCLTTHMYVYMYVQAHTPDTRELQTVLFTKARALFRPFWAIVSAVYPKEHQTRTHTHVHTHARARTHTQSKCIL